MKGFTSFHLKPLSDSEHNGILILELHGHSDVSKECRRDVRSSFSNGKSPTKPIDNRFQFLSKPVLKVIANVHTRENPANLMFRAGVARGGRTGVHAVRGLSETETGCSNQMCHWRSRKLVKNSSRPLYESPER